uniref:DUF5641 domain-containing protein n=1 Tax=Strigamia maritima TaxID=126957 RepID=T1IZL1_STRMM
MTAFWTSWKHLYLSQLRNYHESRGVDIEQSLKPGTVVLVEKTASNPYFWPLARIKTLFPGRDGVVRAAEVTMDDGSPCFSFFWAQDVAILMRQFYLYLLFVVMRSVAICRRVPWDPATLLICNWVCCFDESVIWYPCLKQHENTLKIKLKINGFNVLITTVLGEKQTAQTPLESSPGLGSNGVWAVCFSPSTCSLLTTCSTQRNVLSLSLTNTVKECVTQCRDQNSVLFSSERGHLLQLKVSQAVFLTGKCFLCSTEQFHLVKDFQGQTKDICHHCDSELPDFQSELSQGYLHLDLRFLLWKTSFFCELWTVINKYLSVNRKSGALPIVTINPTAEKLEEAKRKRQAEFDARQATVQWETLIHQTDEYLAHSESADEFPAMEAAASTAADLFTEIKQLWPKRAKSISSDKYLKEYAWVSKTKSRIMFVERRVRAFETQQKDINLANASANASRTALLHAIKTLPAVSSVKSISAVKTNLATVTTYGWRLGFFTLEGKMAGEMIVLDVLAKLPRELILKYNLECQPHTPDFESMLVFISDQVKGYELTDSSETKFTPNPYALTSGLLCRAVRNPGA